jgi:hypothetical protein
LFATHQSTTSMSFSTPTLCSCTPFSQTSHHRTPEPCKAASPHTTAKKRKEKKGMLPFFSEVSPKKARAFF